ncbi:MAG: metal-sensitive transcriptional regulator [Candidatus Omnitrophota bacterium]
MNQKTTHSENLASLKRVEGQVKGIQRMVDGEKYCIDIITQIYASINALHAVAENIFSKHIEHCVVSALKGRSQTERSQKIKEMMLVLKRFRKMG